MQSVLAERRHELRRRRGWQVVVGRPGDQPVRSRLLDVSSGGLCVRTTAALNVGDAVFMVLAVQGRAAPAEGTVVGVSLRPHRECDLHIAFSWVAPPGRVAMTQLFEKTS
jgi:hypothetical protein